MLWAIKRKRTDIAKILIESGADINHEDNEGTHIIHYAVFSGSYELLELLINAGAKLKAKDQYGLTALVYALKEKNPQMIKIIKDYGGSY